MLHWQFCVGDSWHLRSRAVFWFILSSTFLLLIVVLFFFLPRVIKIRLFVGRFFACGQFFTALPFYLSSREFICIFLVPEWLLVQCHAPLTGSEITYSSAQVADMYFSHREISAAHEQNKLVDEIEIDWFNRFLFNSLHIHEFQLNVCWWHTNNRIEFIIIIIYVWRRCRPKNENKKCGGHMLEHCGKLN